VRPIQLNNHLKRIRQRLAGRRDTGRAPGFFPIAYKLALVFTLLISGGMVLLGVLVAQDQTRLLQKQMADFGLTVARQAAEAATEPLLAEDSLTLQVITSNLVDSETILGVAVYSEEGEPVVEAGAVPPPQRLRLNGNGAEIPSVNWTGTTRQGTRVSLSSFISPVTFREVTAGYALITFDRSVMEEAQQETLRAVSFSIALLVVLGLLASVWLGKRLTRPIYDLMDASRAISQGNYQFRFDERRNDEIGALMLSMNTMTEGLLRKEQVEQTFSRYVSPNVAREVLDHLERVELGGRHIEASVLFADIVGFTSMSENMQPDEVSDLLNEYFSYIAQAAHTYNGHVDKYIGDCAMLLFGVPTEDPDHQFNAAACAVLIQQLVAKLNAERTQRGLTPVQFRIGINSGTMLAGNMGSQDRMEYTVVGDAVNLGSRLASVGGPGQIVITEEMHNVPELASRIRAEQLGTIRLRGKREPVATYLVQGVAREHQRELNRKLSRILKAPSESL
jgi:adenylate cyclase